MKPRILLLLVLLALPSFGADAVRDAVGAPASSPRTGESLETATVRAASRLRCPVCQGLSVQDSPATMAVNMKGEVREMMARGYDEEQVLRYFEHAYGQFVLLDPPKRGVNWVVWMAPGVVLFAGLLLILRLGRGKRQEAGDGEDAELAPYIARVRAIAAGDGETE